jgi:cyclopropane-fatty-acyl-phospholipid synthase
MWMKALDHMLRRSLTEGALIVYPPDGPPCRYGDPEAPPVTVRLHDPALPRRIMLNPDLGIGEGYMDGTLTIDGDDLHGFLSVGVRNSQTAWQYPLHRLLWKLRRLSRIVRQYNPTPRARKRVAHHYDLSGGLYELFLDDDRQYSCGYFRDPADTLEAAQAQKKAHIAGKLRLAPGMRVLDIGCGWGGLGLTLARDYGVRVLGVTLSEEQHRTATARARKAGLADRAEFRLMDYREVEGIFDRVVSVGMFEHVGAPHYRAYFRTVRDRLAADGVALVHTIGRTTPPGANSPWIEKYIFPGGYIPALSEMMAAVEKEGLVSQDIEVWRLHYAYTLRHWHDRFVANIDRASALYDERFCRMWRYYLVACEETFKMSRQVVFQVQLGRKLDAVPVTRDYLYAGAADGREMAAE